MNILKNNENIFVTSDLHFFHKNILEYTHRPWGTREEMNEALIENHNKEVSKKDRVYLLGDICFSSRSKAAEILSRMNGRKHLVFGNHDEALKSNKFKEHAHLFDSMGFVKEVQIYGVWTFMSHFSHRTWHRQGKGAIHLYGHSHGSLPEDPNSLSMDVGIDTHPEFKPYHMEDVLNYMALKKADIQSRLGENRFTEDHHSTDENKADLINMIHYSGIEVR